MISATQTLGDYNNLRNQIEQTIINFALSEHKGSSNKASRNDFLDFLNRFCRNFVFVPVSAIFITPCESKQLKVKYLDYEEDCFRLSNNRRQGLTSKWCYFWLFKFFFESIKYLMGEILILLVYEPDKFPQYLKKIRSTSLLLI